MPDSQPSRDPALPDRPTVAIAGASGFVGTALREALAADYHIVGLTRSRARAGQHDPDDPTEWRHCDLFSLLDLEQALDGVDLAIYLVHSMLPSARLTQGTFADLDLLLADNFARAAAHHGLRQIVYLSGLLPDDRDDLSPHLESRYEVEQTLAARSVPVTTLRAGLVVGPGGSSLRILVNLVRRLPAMILPRWTRSDTQPVALDDIVRAFRFCLANPATYGGTYDIGGPDVLSYREMMVQAAEVMGRDRAMVGVPVLTPNLSKLWVSVVSGSPQDLAGPLIESLRHDMVARDNPVQAHLAPEALPFREALKAAIDDDGRMLPSPRKPLRSTDDDDLRAERHVRSVQRLALPHGRDAEWAAQEYLDWLPRFSRTLVRVRVDDEGPQRIARFFAPLARRPLLELTHVPDRSSPDRSLFHVTGGLLAARTKHPGRLEFRAVLDNRYLLAAIHDFTPRLPWMIYRFTQALAHLFVMHRFGRHLERVTVRDR